MSSSSKNNAATPQTDEVIKETAQNTLPLDLAIIQAQCVNDLLHEYYLFFITIICSISTVCFEKCAHKLSEASLGPGEFTCVDRCTTQYYRAHLKLVQDSHNANGNK